jgi:hypothetical protein
MPVKKFGEDCLIGSMLAPQEVNHGGWLRNIPVRYFADHFILIPSTILFIASDAIEITSQIRLIDKNSCPEFARWLQLKRLGIRVDFRRMSQREL